jgi:hypothetical protein
VIELCPGMSYSHDADANMYIYVLLSGRIADNKIIEMDRNEDPCTVAWNGLIQTVHEPCVYDSDCNGNNCVTQSASSAGACL